MAAKYIRMDKKFKQQHFSDAVKEKMFSQMARERRRIGVREIAEEIGISAATLSRVENGKTPDIETVFKVCIWLDRKSSDFYNDK